MTDVDCVFNARDTNLMFWTQQKFSNLTEMYLIQIDFSSKLQVLVLQSLMKI